MAMMTTLAMVGAFPALHSQAQDPFDELEEEVSSSQDSQAGKTAAERYGEYRQAQSAEYEAYRKKLLAEYEKYRQIEREEQARFDSKVAEQWDDPVTSTRKEWVEYAGDLKERSRVDFEKQTITLEFAEEAAPSVAGAEEGDQVDEKRVRSRLTDLVKKDRAQAFADDQVVSAIEARAKEEVEYLETAPVQAEPLLSAYLTGKQETSDADIEAIVDNMMDGMEASVSEDSKGRTIQTAIVPLSAPESVLGGEPPAPGGKGRPAPGALPRKAANVWRHVDSSASDVDVPHALILAIIETESAYNPQAKSGVPAYGLMQIVPTSAGMDATEQLFGKPRLLAPSYLYDSQKNIEIGSVYLQILFYRYLKGIEDPLSRLYCSIAAYNTGAGNVSRAFTGSRRIKNAIPKINELSPQQVYDHLIENLPHGETRKYLDRVSKRKAKYEGMGA